MEASRYLHRLSETLVIGVAWVAWSQKVLSLLKLISQTIALFRGIHIDLPTHLCRQAMRLEHALRDAMQIVLTPAGA